ncbi:hypothetical protein WS58_12020 [Burkholderia pseudomultivorans]|nr:hypothetical protein B1M_27084 [Burkholderia sp. TJI49]KVC26750.1 hypothetical protein WS56_26490 [Burkholderia pseudomultivorans]KVC30018.1 hypothetical protein WS55_09655 [Burkholderia pseudomultivorans]KVC46623.1 hypothetical protein WS58_12020 [Burkholderia pseudomultivorans]
MWKKRSIVRIRRARRGKNYRSRDLAAMSRPTTKRPARRKKSLAHTTRCVAARSNPSVIWRTEAQAA